MEKKNRNTMAFVLGVTAAVLAAMGCWFCWHCPSRVYPPETHGLFWRQLAWNGVGLAAFVAAWLAGWKRLLKAAPWLMAAWVVAIAVAQFSRPVNGAHKWLSIGTIHVNVVTCFMPVFALFLAWLHEKKWIRPWMKWTAIAAAATWAVWYVAGNVRRVERLAAFFNQGNWRQDMVYMSRQLLAAFDVSKWFGDADRSLGFLPCPESDGMMSASALMFGKWFPAFLVGLFAVVGTSLTLLWKDAVDVSKRRFTLLFGLWLIVPAAYCLFHSLAFLPVAGMSPALASYGGTAVVMAWFGVGVLVAAFGHDKTHLSQDGDCEGGTRSCASIACIWGAVACVAVLLIAFAPKREFWTPGGDLKFAEPRPSDMEFGEFGFAAKRGRILAADGSPLAYTVRKWGFYLDPCAADVSVYDKDCFREIAEGLGVPIQSLLEAYVRKDKENIFLRCCEAAHELGVSMSPLFDASDERGNVRRGPRRYIFLTEVEDNSSPAEYFNRRHQWLTRRAGIIREPVQKRVYPLESAATAVVGFMIAGAHTDNPVGGGGIESACNKSLAGVNGVYDRELPLKERSEKATPKSGADIRTTLVPEIQKAVAEALSSACATNGAESAFALVMKVPSGEIAAMASWPTFDPSMRRDLDKWDGSMAVNRPAQVLFEPGGLVKPLTYAIALDSGALAEDAKIDQENGVWEYNGVTIRDDETNTLSIAEAISSRANIAAGKTSCLIGPEKFHAALRRFGFGSKTGAAGISGEESGIIAGKPERWDKTTAMRVGMGYGFAVTGLQIAQAYATLANKGMMVHPRLLSQGEAKQEGEQRQVVSSKAADAVVGMLNGGIASAVQTVVGSSYSPTNHIASYVGFCPADTPRYVVAVAFDRPLPIRRDEDAAHPAFAAIVDNLERYSISNREEK